MSTTHSAFGARRTARPTTWWGRAWLRAVEEATYAETELKSARAITRAAGVGALTVSPGQVVAAVRDGDALYPVACRLPVFDDDAMATLVEVVAAETGRIGALLAGELPHPLVEHADDLGAELLPSGPEFETSCSCEGWLDPCPHALAVLLQAGWLLDADPLVLFALRGLSRDDLVARLHSFRPPVRSLDSDPSDPEAITLDLAEEAMRRAQDLLGDDNLS